MPQYERLLPFADFDDLDIRRRAASRSPAGSILAEGLCDLVSEGFDEERHHRPRLGFDECFNWHPWNELPVAKTRDLLVGQADTHFIVTAVRFLILDGVWRDTGHRAVDLRRRSHVESGEAERGGLSDVNLIDVARLDLYVHDQAVMFRYDLHDRFAWRDHRTGGVYGQLVNESGLRRADIGALELLFGSDFALPKFD